MFLPCAYAVSQRYHEFGVRLALGAGPSELIIVAMRGGVRIILWGVGLGLLGALVLTWVLSSLLYGVQPLDPPALIGVSLLLITAG
jgi:ABC-type antimicrobial peptide transport system permease subunit